MSRSVTVLLSVAFLTVGLNLPTAFSTVQPELTQKERQTVKKIAKKQAIKQIDKKHPIDTDDLIDGAVSTAKLQNEAVNSTKIESGAVGIPELTPGAVTGADYTEMVTIAPLPDDSVSETVVRSITLSLPGPGTVIVNVSSWVAFESTPAGVRCSITKGSSTNFGVEPLLVFQGNNNGNERRKVISGTRGFTETIAGNQTYNFVCYTQDGAAGIYDALMTAIFAPTRL